MKRKTDVDNKRNFAAWQNNGQEYDICVDYPGKANTLFFKKPSIKPVCETTMKYPIGKTIVFQRHAFSCANLSKKKGFVYSALEDEKDPSLCLYGILSVLSLDRTSTTVEDKRTPVFEGTVFTSQLIRTWQTSILEFARLDFLPKSGPKTLYIIISPFIIEGGMGSSNTPLGKSVQIYKMTQFMTLLQNIYTLTIDHNVHEKIKKILECDIVIQEEGEDVFLYRNGAIIPVYLASYGKYDPSGNIKREIEGIKRVGGTVGGFNIPSYDFEYNTEIIESSFNAMIHKLPDNGAYTNYYGEFGFGYFYQWLQKFKFKNIFVVGHGIFMKNVIKAYSGFEDTQTESYFNENAWRFQIDNNRVKLTHGINKPRNIDSMTDEPLCYGRIRVEQLKQKKLIIKERLASSTVERPELRKESQPRSELRQSTVERPELIQESQPRSESRQSTVERPELRKESQPRSESREKTQPIQSTSVSTRQTGTLKRAYRILFDFLTNKENLSELIALVNSREPLKAKCMNYIQKHDIFSNHFLAFVLMYPPYLKKIIENLDSSVKQAAIYTYITYCFGASNVSIKKIRQFLIDFSKLIQSDEELYNLVLGKINSDANTFYYHNFSPNYLFGTLLDLFYYEMHVYPLTPDTKDFTFKIIHDLIENGARFSKYSKLPRDMYEVIDFIELLSDEEIITIMKELQIAPNETLKDDALKTYLAKKISNEIFEKTKTFQEIQRYFIDVRMNLKEGAIDDSKLLDFYKCPILSPDVHFEIDSTMKLDPMETVEDYFKKHIIYSGEREKLIGVFLEGGRYHVKRRALPLTKDNDTRRIKGTSSSKTSLRQPLVKRATRRVSLYKGKRRTKVNRR